MLHIFRTAFPKNTSGLLLLDVVVDLFTLLSERESLSIISIGHFKISDSFGEIGIYNATAFPVQM